MSRNRATDTPTLEELQLYTTEQAAPLLGVTPKTLYNWRYRHKGPAYLLMGKEPRYRLRDIQVWLDSLTQVQPQASHPLVTKAKMRKAWTYKRKNRPGWYVVWYEGETQCSKRLPNKAEAERFREGLQRQMNDELYSGSSSLPWDTLTAQFLKYHEEVKGVMASTLREYHKTLTAFERLCGTPESGGINHKLIERFIAERRKEGTAGATINKDLRGLKALVNWGLAQRHMGAPAKDIPWGNFHQKEQEKLVRALSVEEWSRLLYHAGNLYGRDWVIRLLLAVGTGLRQQDIEALQVESIHFDQGGLSTHSTKTGKGMGLRPLAAEVLDELRAYIGTRTQGRILQDTYHHTKWERIVDAAGLQGLRYHDLRATSGTFIALAGFSTSVAQDWLEHSTERLTKRIYLNVSPARRAAAQSIPAGQALEGMKQLQTQLQTAVQEVPTTAEQPAQEKAAALGAATSEPTPTIIEGEHPPATT